MPPWKIDAGIRRVKGVKKLGMGLGNGLMAEQGHALWQAPHHPHLKENAVPRLAGVDTRVGRHEAVALRLDHLQEHWPIVDLVGKGRAFRIISLVPFGRYGT
jgi:hypothetical protein